MNRIKIFVLTAVFLIQFSCIENSRSYYANYSELREDDIIERGWIPDFLPLDSEEIYETHNIDINSTYGKFSYKSDLWIDSSNFRNYEFNIDSLKNKIKKINRPKKPKWFISDKELTDKDLLILRKQDWIIIADTFNQKCYFIR
ncbi:MAG: hypothetical protein V1779_15240 [bacterium]